MTTTTVRITLGHDAIEKMLSEVKADLSCGESDDFRRSTLYSTPGGLWINVCRRRTFAHYPWPTEAEVQIYPARPTKPDSIRAEITRPEGELSRISGEPLDLEYHDTPDGGAILEYAPT